MFQPLAGHLLASKGRDIKITTAGWLCRLRSRVRITPGSCMSVS